MPPFPATINRAPLPVLGTDITVPVTDGRMVPYANLDVAATPADTVVVTFVAEHHANLLPWRRVVRLPPPNSPDEAVAAIDRALRRHGPALVSVTAASNVTGEVWPIADTRGPPAGMAPALPSTPRNSPRTSRSTSTTSTPTTLPCPGHKLYAPFGAGVLAGRSDWLDAAQPYLRGGGASTHVDSTGTASWTAGAARHEAGTPNLLGAVALAAVCAALTPQRWNALVDQEDHLLTAHGGLPSTAIRASLGAGTTGAHVRRLSTAIGAIAAPSRHRQRP